jgi:magnesium chelatase subunit I
MADIYASMPALTGKFELEYEGEMKGADNVARELIRGAIGKVFQKYFSGADLEPVVQWFQLGGTLKLPELTAAGDVIANLRKIQGLVDKASILGIKAKDGGPQAISAAEFILEGLYAQRRIGRSEQHGFVAEEKRQSAPGREEYRPPAKRQYN